MLTNEFNNRILFLFNKLFSLMRVKFLNGDRYKLLFDTSWDAFKGYANERMNGTEYTCILSKVPPLLSAYRA